MTATVSLISNTASVADGIHNPPVALAAVISYVISTQTPTNLVFEFVGGNQVTWRFLTSAKCTAAKGHIDALVTAAQDIANT